MFITLEMDSVPGLRQYLLHFVVVVVKVKRPLKTPTLSTSSVHSRRHPVLDTKSCQ